MGTFITLRIEPQAISATQAAQLVRLCPVDIFGLADDRLTVKTENEDECTLCELCLKAAPKNAIRIEKSYKDEILISTGEAEQTNPT